MSKGQVNLLENRARIHDLLMGFFAMRSWTPAMGAQLVCGIQPVPNCTEIPESACQLSNPLSPATPTQLMWANKVLNRWTEESEDDDGTALLPSLMSPIAFMMWCCDSYEQLGPPFRPEWLDYIWSLCDASSDSSPPVAGAIDLVKRAIELERFASVVSEHTNSSEPKNIPDHQSFLECTLDLSKKRKIRSVIATEIAIAMDMANNPHNVGEIWTLLCQRANNKDSKLLATPGPESFNIPREGGHWVAYKRGTLEKYLHRFRKLLSEYKK